MDEVVMETRGLQGQKGFTMKNSVKAFNILSDSLYMNKALAVIRELSTNAYDAHISAGTQDVPFEIHLPDEMSPYFYIRDFGTGLSDDQVLNLYTTYFDSTKTDSVDATGALGLGSKSPFSVVDDFSVVSYQGGKARTYFAYKNEEGFPCISFVSENDADEPNGIKIQFAVRRDKYHDFKVNLPMAVYHFDPKPAILNVSVNTAKEGVALKGDNWEIAENGGGGYFLGDKPFVVMARVSYPIDIFQLEHLFEDEELYLLSLCKVPLRIYVPNRSVDHTPSREHLQYTKKTVRTIKEELKKIHEELMSKIREEFADCSSVQDVEERCFFLKEMSDENLLVDPWKSMQRVFGPGEFRQYGRLFNHNVDLVMKDGVTTVKANLYALHELASHHRPSRSTTIQLSDVLGQGVSSIDILKTWRRLMVKVVDKWQSTSNKVDTDEEIEKAQAFNPNKSFEEIRTARLRSLKERLKSPQFEASHVSLSEKMQEVVDDFGSVNVTKFPHVDRTKISFTMKRRNIRLAFIVDDYPKDVSAQLRAGYMRALCRNYSDYLIFTNTHRSGGRFNKTELAAVELTARAVAKNLNCGDIEVLLASEIEVPEVFKIAEPKSYMAKNEYCAFNILTYSGDAASNVPSVVTTLTDHKFKEVPANEMGEDFKLPSFDESNVVYIRRQYNQMDLFGIDGDRQNIRHEYKVGDSDFHELAELVRVFSVFAGEYLLKDKVFVVIKTKAQFEKAQKSKWTSFTDLLKKAILGFDKETIRKLISFLSLANRHGISECSKHINEFTRRATNKAFASKSFASADIVKAPMSSISGLTAHFFVSSSKIEIKDIEAKLSTLSDLPKCEYQEIVADAVDFFRLNEKLKSESKMFNEFSMNTGSYGFYSGNARGILVKSSYISQILSFVLEDKYYVQAKNFMIKCKNVVEKYPLIGAYSSKFTKDESQWVTSNIARSAELFPSLVQYIKLVEGV